ncbi:MAG TPA: peptidoglycan editing factor PgeF [Myxococcales bacterium]
MLYLKSKLLDDASVPHGFSLRTGGVSLPPYDSLNLGFSAGDDPQAVATNLARLREAAGLHAEIATAKQVHGDRIVDDRLREILPASVAQEDGADALISERAPVGVRAADCAPILLFGGGKVAAAHSGWKGTRLRIAARTVAAMKVPPRQIAAAIGPCIGRCCYEVSPELAAEFRALFGKEAVEGERHLDLRFCIETALREAGVERIEQVAGCTSCDTNSFFSHRRDKGRTGRHLAFIAPAQS